VICTWAASPLVYYQFGNVSMSHGAAFFAVSLLAFSVYRATRASKKIHWWVIAGGALGLAVVIRYQLALFSIPALWALFTKDEARSRLARTLALAAGALPFGVLQSVAWRGVYGEWLVFSYGVEGEKFHWGSPEVWNSFFSAWHGLVYWHPIALVGVGGLAAWIWRARAGTWAWGISFGLILYVNAAWWCWWFASSFGNRGYDAAWLPLMAGMAWLFRSTSGFSRAACWSVAITLGLWNFYVMVLYRTGAISRSEPVTWSEMFEAGSRLGDAAQF
jgi:hypothetical protein